MGKVLKQTKCPNRDCGSSDAFTVYSDNRGNPKDATCFSCDYWTNDQAILKAAINGTEYDSSDNLPAIKTEPLAVTRRQTFQASSSRSRMQFPESIDECLLHPVMEIKDRGLSRATCERYGVRVGVDTRDGVTPVYHLYPYYDEKDISGIKVRNVADKSFLSIGTVSASLLFGSQVVNSTGKKIYITEGELDALALYQILKENSSYDWEPQVVSLPNGAKSAVKAISENLDLLNGYEQVILVFDNDVYGREAADKVCKILAGKVYTVKCVGKDPNEALLSGRGNDLKWACLTGAKKYQPDGIVNGKDCWDRYKNSSTTESYPYPESMPLLNKKTYGVRPGSIVTVTSGSGCGKTQFLRELKYHYLMTTDFKIADISLEEDVGDTIGGMLALKLNKRIQLPDVNVTEEEEKEAFQAVYGTGRIDIYDFFGGMDDDTLFSKLRYLIYSGNKILFLDHLSIIVSEYASEGGERERIDTIMTKLAKLVKETGAIIFLVVHLKKSDSSRTTFEQGAIPSLDDLRGSGAIKQLSWDVIGLSRNQQHPSRMCANTSLLTVLKCRFTGRTGQADFLYFDETTGRMINTEQPQGYFVEQKKRLA